MKKFLLITIILASILSCGKPIEPDRDIAYYKEAGDEYFAKKKYTEAINAYQNALARAEDPVAASLIQLAIADTYYADKEYIDAIPVYEIYLDLYPSSQASTLAYIKLGLSHYEIRESANRDITDAQKAIDYFEIVRKRDLRSYYDFALGEKTKEMRDLVADKEYKVARYYSRIWEDNSSIRRYEYIMDKYSDTKIASLSLYRLVKLLTNNKRVPEAEKYMELFKLKFADTEYYQDAEKLIIKAKEKAEALSSKSDKSKKKPADEVMITDIKDNSTAEILIDNNSTEIIDK